MRGLREQKRKKQKFHTIRVIITNDNAVYLTILSCHEAVDIVLCIQISDDPASQLLPTFATASRHLLKTSQKIPELGKSSIEERLEQKLD